jgi:acetoacetyl-CoA synthetase
MTFAERPGVLWRPTRHDIDNANATAFMRWLREHRGVDLQTWNELWQWSVQNLEEFWSAMWDHYDLTAVGVARRPDRMTSDEAMPDTRWFAGAELNYAQNILARAPRTRPALIEVAEDAVPREWSTDDLAGSVGALSRYLLDLGVSPGDRVAAYLPNTAEAVVGLLATTAIGAVWASCGPEFGVTAVTDRFGQISPKVLLAVDGYRFGGRTHERGDIVDELRRRLPSLEATVMVRTLRPTAAVPEGTVAFDEIVATPRTPTFTPVPGEHPLWILFSSGSTGLPKGIVHSHAGIVLEHLKSLGLCLDTGPTDTMFFVSSTSWMAWNLSIGALLHGASVVLSSASPGYPGPDGVFTVAAQTRATIVGLGSAYVTALAKQHAEPQDRMDLSGLRLIIPTGSPLPPNGWAWIAQRIPARIDSICGGTDVCTFYFCGNPLTAVRSGEIGGCSLGVDAQSWDAHGQPQIGAVGEMMVTTPMPSMPLRLWNDPTGERYRSTYFDKHPHVWRQGDWIMITEDGAVTVTGRSDATLNRGGVRLGSAEIYTAVDQFDEFHDSLVIGAELGGGRYLLALFVVLTDGVELDDHLRRRIEERLRTELSPRHVPDVIAATPVVPRTLTGKKLEVPVKAILQGAEPGSVAAPGAVDHPEALQWFSQWIEQQGVSA